MITAALEAGIKARREDGAWTFTRPTRHPVPSSWPATYTSYFGERWKRFMETTAHRLPGT